MVSEFLNKKIYDIFSKLESLQVQVEDLYKKLGTSPAPSLPVQPEIPVIAEDIKVRLNQMEAEFHNFKLKLQGESQTEQAAAIENMETRLQEFAANSSQSLLMMHTKISAQLQQIQNLIDQ